MPRFLVPALCCLTGLTGATASAADSVLRLPHVFSDHAVLQRDKPLPVWGWAAPGAPVAVTLATQSRTATADADGKWKVTFDPLAVGAPVELSATSAGATVKAVDLLIGEVWVCSGQSNMQWSTQQAINGPQEVANANFPQIRLLGVPNISSDKPLDDIANSWAVCSPQTVGGFTAVGYFFGRELHQQLNVPIGLIGTSWGGTPAESWTSREALAANPDLAHFNAAFDKAMAEYPVALAKQAAASKASNDTAAAQALDDSSWQLPATDTTAWKDMAQPQNWEKAGLKIDGVVWFRRSVEIAATDAGKDLTLSLGAIDDSDITWFDGTEVGHTDGWNTPRTYTIPAKLATAGTHTIAVRVTDTGGGGGFHGAPEDMHLGSVKLDGAWRYQVAKAIPEPPKPPMGPGNPWLPSSLRNGMITPLIPYAIRGAIWYQGESNASRAWQYRTLFPAMITDWRTAWGAGDFPFGFVQLANFTDARAEPGDSDWAELRDAQLNTLRTLPAIGMGSAIDLGEAKDIHPKNKQDVGKRLAGWALATIHGKSLEWSGPLYTGAKIEDGKIRVAFDHLGGGLVARGGALKRFAIAGDDKKFVWADAVIDGASVVVSSAAVPKPVAVRYAWENNPEGCNLYNQEGLPASPFRTDEWPAITLSNK
jgi:sialate O-acetylesterase